MAIVLVKDFMKTSLVSAKPEETVDSVCKRMKQNHLGAVLVMDGVHMIGIFTERDVLNRVVAEGKDPAVLQVKDVATPHPISVRGSTTIKACADILRTKGFRHLPVVDDNENPIGILSSRDFFQFMTYELEQVIDTFKKSGEKFEENFDPYEYLGAGGMGLPGTPE
jgi:CBS domain-containing protein